MLLGMLKVWSTWVVQAFGSRLWKFLLDSVFLSKTFLVPSVAHTPIYCYCCIPWFLHYMVLIILLFAIIIILVQVIIEVINTLSWMLNLLIVVSKWMLFYWWSEVNHFLVWDTFWFNILLVRKFLSNRIIRVYSTFLLYKPMWV